MPGAHDDVIIHTHTVYYDDPNTIYEGGCCNSCRYACHYAYNNGLTLFAKEKKNYKKKKKTYTYYTYYTNEWYERVFTERRD